MHIQELPVGTQPKIQHILPQSIAGGESATNIAAIKVPANHLMVISGTVFAKDTTDHAVYKFLAAVRNVAGTTGLIGTPVIDSLETDATWALTVAANNTDDTFEIKGTPDATNATVFQGVWVFEAINIV